MKLMTRATKAALYAVAFMLCVYGANYFINHVGEAHPFGPHTFSLLGWDVPSGVVWVGASFTIRDALQRVGGRLWVWCAIVAGALLSMTVATSLALASGFTFLVSEAMDFFVFTRLHRHNVLAAALVSNVIGSIIDSVLFLWIAFNWSAVEDFAWPQIVTKILFSLPFLPLLWTRREPALAH